MFVLLQMIVLQNIVLQKIEFFSQTFYQSSLENYFWAEISPYIKFSASLFLEGMYYK